MFLGVSVTAPVYLSETNSEATRALAVTARHLREITDLHHHLTKRIDPVHLRNAGRRARHSDLPLHMTRAPLGDRRLRRSQAAGYRRVRALDAGQYGTRTKGGARLVKRFNSVRSLSLTTTSALGLQGFAIALLDHTWNPFSWKL